MPFAAPPPRSSRSNGLVREAPRTLGLVGIGTMGENCLRCLTQLYRFEEIVCTSRRPETREAFARKWSEKLKIPVRTLDTIEEVVRRADIAIGGTTSTEIVSREHWVKPGATFVSLARREMDPAGWSKFDKVVIDDWDCNMTVREFRNMIDAGEFSRAQLHADIGEVVAGQKPGRQSKDERDLASHDRHGLTRYRNLLAHLSGGKGEGPRH